MREASSKNTSITDSKDPGGVLGGRRVGGSLWHLRIWATPVSDTFGDTVAANPLVDAEEPRRSVGALRLPSFVGRFLQPAMRATIEHPDADADTDQ